MLSLTEIWIVSGDPAPLCTTEPLCSHSILVALDIVHVMEAESPTMYIPKKCCTRDENLSEIIHTVTNLEILFH